VAMFELRIHRYRQTARLVGASPRNTNSEWQHMRRLFFSSFILMILAANASAQVVELFQHGDPVVNATWLPPGSSYYNSSGWYRITEESYIDLEGILDSGIEEIVVTYFAIHGIMVNVHLGDHITQTYALEDPELGWESVLSSGELRIHFIIESQCDESNFDYEAASGVSVVGVTRDVVSTREHTFESVKALYR
jgi:hypothetical protein